MALRPVATAGARQRGRKAKSLLRAAPLLNASTTQHVLICRHISSAAFAGGKLLTSDAFKENKRAIHTTRSLNKEDYYKVLGVSKTADAKEIKKAYYQLAKKFHPDVAKDPGSQKKFQEISEAYEVLGDATKRQDYDQFGMAGGAGAGGFGGHPGAGFQGHAGGFQNFHSNIDPEELFRKIFGNAGFQSTGFNNFNDFAESNFGFAAATEVSMPLTFQQAARGCNKDIRLNVTDNCPKCQGEKAEPGTRKTRCHHCNGTGMETISTGPFMMRSTCRHCHGTRVLIPTPCTECQGKGKTVQRKTVTVPVPAGVEDGQTVRMPVGNKEVFITFKVEKSREFRREGADVHSDVRISLSQAVLGGTIRIPGIYEETLLNIPPGTSSHTRIRLAGKGISRPHSYGRGDHYLHVKIAIPVKMNDKQKALLKAFAETENGVEGTVNGVTHTDDGKRAIDDSDGLVQQLRNILNPELLTAKEEEVIEEVKEEVIVEEAEEVKLEEDDVKKDVEEEEVIKKENGKI
ncbi:hypothetical protein CAPTEDRAFT_151304 [Capitella teleta]|uniref:Uncharacterized protein n=1 Tax=Capitella teleta TaxID=283909 RepID=R7TPK9_CAPTE|nr:hypothetical protein CAPTEDRAFT_151304 [Capitella teleta]|eukprot:ELT93451.1 hypothetical protein CAPTEDRAFT_151304 [Capitella teleta]